MRRNHVLNLADCTEFRQTLEARPPMIVHGTALLLVTLLGIAVGWSWLTQANLVVRSPGRVRPVSTPTQVSASFGSRLDGRVVEVNYKEGKPVQEGQLLIRLETESLDNEIAKKRETIQTAGQELARLQDLETLLERELQTAKAKAQAELKQAQAKHRRAGKQRETELRLAKSELQSAEEKADRMRQLYERKAASKSEWEAAKSKLHRAQDQLAKAELPVDDEPIEVARQALELVKREYAARQAELQMKTDRKKGEIQAAEKELANLELERRQAEIRAPISGVVISPEVKVDDLIERGKPVVQIAPQKGFRFEAGVPSGDVGHLRIGMPVRIKFDAYDYQEYGTLDGTVEFISPDSKVSDAEQASPPAYLVRVDMTDDTLSNGEKRGKVKLGMTGRAEIVTGSESLLSLLVQKIRQTISLG